MSTFPPAEPLNASHSGEKGLLELTATDAVNAMKAGDIKAETYAASLLRRAASLDFLNAFISLDADQVLNMAHAADALRTKRRDLGPLHGLPIGLKDLLNTSGLPTTGGTPALANIIPKTGNAKLVDVFCNAGAIMFGKTNMHELSFGATSVNPHTGAVANPYDPSLIAGGSSGGSAAAVAARMVPCGIGGDTAGSVRIPASLCGVCGLRPTIGRWPGDVESVIPISDTRDTLGPIARSCFDLELLDRVVTQSSRVRPARLSGLRLGVVPHFFSDLEPGVAQVTRDALNALEAAGVELVKSDMPELVDLTMAASFTIMLFEVVPNLTAYLTANTMKLDGSPIRLLEVVGQIMSPDVKGLFESILTDLGGTPIAEHTYLEALKNRQKLRRTYRQYFRRTSIAAQVFPTTVLPATPVDNSGSIIDYIHNTDAGSLAGLPGVALPIGLTNGLPVSLGIDGLPGSDRTLLAIAMAMEERVFGRLQAPLI